MKFLASSNRISNHLISNSPYSFTVHLGHPFLGLSTPHAGKAITMLPLARARLGGAIARSSPVLRRSIGSTAALRENREQPNNPNPPANPPNYSATNETPLTAVGAKDEALVESAEEGEKQRQMQAPNRKDVWARSQQPRSKAMVGPRFEQTIMEYQPQPYAAIDLIHKQPVRWTHDRIVACDGGGGPLGHPKIFINVDKPQICWCTYCGVPFAHEHHRKHLESLPSTSYPLGPTNDPAEVEESQQVTDGVLEQR
ncbi:putative nadh-ubiquinone oxidoreductase [Phaeomoniella chlamydospora]|uniref:Putative nadh-ubiquinone oxidoreductase n=1 Tax=Phaeomoniella chlamydospora TaxID=158046 RepID=A0A0G2F267_PHACM|nr:putative nadh-ubiquinone oxidoreductase [Phaeomoniella chlamydospora]